MRESTENEEKHRFLLNVGKNYISNTAVAPDSDSTGNFRPENHHLR